MYTSDFPRCLTRKGYIDLASLSFELVEFSFVTELIVATELLETVCSRVFCRSRPFVAVRLSLGS